MRQQLQDIIDAFAMADDEMRLELLLDYARKLPPLPERLRAQRDAGMNRVPECMTPVFLFVERDNGAVHLHVDVAEEAPTVQGFLAIVIAAYDGASAEEFAELPADLLHKLRLSKQIRMNRAIGLNAITARIRRIAETAATAADGYSIASGPTS
jgi:cysteine desulfuration protein SufE